MPEEAREDRRDFLKCMAWAGTGALFAFSGAERTFVKDGFAVNEWSRNGLRFAAVSDIPPGELSGFRKLFEQRSG